LHREVQVPPQPLCPWVHGRARAAIVQGSAGAAAAFMPLGAWKGESGHASWEAGVSGISGHGIIIINR